MKTIVCVDSKWGIGKKNGLLFRLPKDMAFFKQMTTGKVVAMGANTFLSFPKGALPNRVNIVLDDQGRKFEGATTVPTLFALLAKLNEYDTDDVFVIGGASVYRQLLPYCEKAYVTVFCRRFEKDVWFPDLDELPEWRLVCESEPVFGKFRGAGGAEGEISFVFREYSREKAAPLFT